MLPPCPVICASGARLQRRCVSGSQQAGTCRACLGARAFWPEQTTGHLHLHLHLPPPVPPELGLRPMPEGAPGEPGS